MNWGVTGLSWEVTGLNWDELGALFSPSVGVAFQSGPAPHPLWPHPLLPPQDGRPLAGAWSRDSAHVTRNRLVLGVTPEDDGATLRCRAVTSLPGGGGSASVQLEVTYPPSEVTLSGSGSVPLNGSATLGCTSAPSNPPVRLRWWLGGRQLEPSGGGPTPVTGSTGVNWGVTGRSLG
ncbi:nephrin-like [Corapipo altera]|uniref:nephrin-like n=1 Tax=Corapipo altera TaxID=415028 RepID=UPI000FD63229|nr:nephrin-like [Corapipo altera]